MKIISRFLDPICDQLDHKEKRNGSLLFTSLWGDRIKTYNKESRNKGTFLAGPAPAVFTWKGQRESSPGKTRKSQSIQVAHLLWSQQLGPAGLGSGLCFLGVLEALADVQKEQIPRNLKEIKWPLFKESFTLSYRCSPCRELLLLSSLSYLSSHSSGQASGFLLPLKLLQFTSQNRSCPQSHQALCSARFQRIMYGREDWFHAGT